jgi:hypothetical protein
MAIIKMFGPSISNPKQIVNRDVPECDVQAYRAAGYKVGSLPETESSVDLQPVIVAEPQLSDDLPEDFPGLAALTDAGLSTYAAVRGVEDLTTIPGIGKVTAEKIAAALEEKK